MRATEELSCPNIISLSPFNISPMRFIAERRWKRSLQVGIAYPQTILLTSYIVLGNGRPTAALALALPNSRASLNFANHKS